MLQILTSPFFFFLIVLVSPNNRKSKNKDKEKSDNHHYQKFKIPGVAAFCIAGRIICKKNRIFLTKNNIRERERII
jgi:hypothetical protein